MTIRDVRPATKMADIAKLAGVSASTVSRALAGSPLVAKSQREQIVRLATEHGYVINAMARNLRLQRTEIISVVIPLGHAARQPLTDPFFAEFLGHLADEITSRGYGVLLQKALPPMDDWLPRLIGSQRSDGIIVIGQSTEHVAIEKAAAHYVPLVVWGAQGGTPTYCTIGSDNVGGARVAVEHLIRLGRRCIAFLGDSTAPELRLRFEGYQQAIQHSGDTLVSRQITVPSNLTADDARTAVQSILGENTAADAVFAATDVIALNAIRALTAAGRRVPEDIAVIGYDDIPLATQITPALTTVRQDLALGARTLVDHLLRRIAGEQTPSVVLPATLVVRDSCGASLSR